MIRQPLADAYQVTRTQLLGVAVAAAVLLFIAEAKLGATTYRLNGLSYSVPHQYEFLRQFRVWWLEGIRGVPKEPDESIWLLLPANELARDIRGYRPVFRGYVSDVEADMVVNVLGRQARDFPADYRRMWDRVANEEKQGASRKVDTATGWIRVVWLGGINGTPAEGHSNFYLVPSSGRGGLPNNWLPPSCVGSPDSTGRERYSCLLTIHQGGLTFDFWLRQENVPVAARIPPYVMSRLSSWRR